MIGTQLGVFGYRHLPGKPPRTPSASSARERYREALALDPHDVDWDEPPMKT